MLRYVLLVFLSLSVLAVGMSYSERAPGYSVYLFFGSIILALGVIAIDLTLPKRSLQALAGVFFGLVVGYILSYGINLIIEMIASAFISPNDLEANAIINAVKLLVGIITCYLCISLIMQTKDDLRFVIPYVEFTKETKGQHPLILDTSVIIDGRVADICETGIIDQMIVVPRFVLDELQLVADSADKLKRTRGRRGLDVLKRLQEQTNVEVKVMESRLSDVEEAEPVDLKLLSLAKKLNGHVATNDYNLNKVAQVRGVKVININDLANALKPVVLPGEAMAVKIVKPGEEMGQGVGYLDDGTMVVVDGGRESIGQTVRISVTSVLQTSAGRMIFGRMEGMSGPGGPAGPMSSPPPRGPRRNGPYNSRGGRE